jgi:hypothetical protein
MADRLDLLGGFAGVNLDAQGFECIRRFQSKPAAAGHNTGFRGFGPGLNGVQVL